MTRRLSLKRETLAPLSENELVLVAAGQAIPTLERCLTGEYPTLPLDYCVSNFVCLSEPTER